MYTYTYYVQSDILPLFKSMSQRQTSTSCPSAIAAPAKTPRPPHGLALTTRGTAAPKDVTCGTEGVRPRAPFFGEMGS